MANHKKRDFFIASSTGLIIGATAAALARKDTRKKIEKTVKDASKQLTNEVKQITHKRVSEKTSEEEK